MRKVLPFIVVGFIITYALVDGLRADFPDTNSLYRGQKGDLSGWAVPQSNGVVVWTGWLYWDPLRYLWKWMSLFTWSFDRILWFVLQSGLLILLSCKLIKEMGSSYATIVLTALSKPLAWFLSGSNVSITLLALVLNPFLLAGAVIFKPYFGILLPVHWWVERRRMGGDQTISEI